MKDSEIKARLVEADKYVGSGKQSSQRPSSRRDRAVLFIFAEAEKGMEQFIYRHSRPVKLYRALLPEIFEALGLPANTKARWSQKAGCSCPCSPGFILDHVEWNHDFYATVTADNPEAAKHDGDVPMARVKKAAQLAAGGI
jgi:hypothetical protein